MTEYITSLFGDAKSILPTLPGDYFDFVFIDAMKREYLDYLLLSLPKMTPDALIVIDDVEKFRPKMENLYTFLDEKNIPYRLEKTDPDDSIMIIEAVDMRKVLA
jgi:predicted O-methyltransferase YrrM